MSSTIGVMIVTGGNWDLVCMCKGATGDEFCGDFWEES